MARCAADTNFLQPVPAVNHTWQSLDATLPTVGQAIGRERIFVAPPRPQFFTEKVRAGFR